MGEEEDTVHTLADRSTYADFLLDIPGFTNCSRVALEEFVTRDVVRVRCAAGKKLSPLTDRDQNLYVLVTGSALLRARDGVAVKLEPGDYFGRSPGRHDHVGITAVALSDIELLVIRPQEVARIGQPMASDRHALRPERQSARPMGAQRTSSHRGHRSVALAGQRS
ncbi:MAG TPA: hypothetical protein VND70_04100 [Acidimicrobiales bacterium]|nr:hypothetical protein [Acidimicrobiales bacterium]